MSAEELHERVKHLYADTLTGERHAGEITGVLGGLVKLTRVAAERAACVHLAGDPYKVTHAAGRDLMTRCVKCGATLSSEATL